MKLHWMTLIAAAVVLPSAAGASPGSCFLSVDGRVYLDGPCTVNIGKDGSFTVGVSDAKRSRYFAYVNVDAATKKADASWNGVEAESHAHDPLGTLSRDGGCWSNARAKVCAWKPGTRPATF
jgi:hypothetical protein